MQLSIDTYTLLVFLAGLLAGIGLYFTCLAGYEHVQVIRHLQSVRRRSDGDGSPTPKIDRERHAG